MPHNGNKLTTEFHIAVGDYALRLPVHIPAPGPPPYNVDLQPQIVNNTHDIYTVPPHDFMAFPSISGAFSAGNNPIMYNFMPTPDMSQSNLLMYDWSTAMNEVLEAIGSALPDTM